MVRNGNNRSNERIARAAARIDLNLVRIFVAVHGAGSFSAAAHKLGVPRSTVSRAIAALEEELDLLLFQRTTRRVMATDAGTSLHDRVAPTLATLEASLADVPDREEEPSGVLRITATADVGRIVLAEVVARFVARYPAVQVDLHASTTMVDLVRDRFDLAVRLSSKSLRDSSLVARKVGGITFQLFAAPAYVARAGAPKKVADLARHDAVDVHGIPLAQLARGRRIRLVEGRTRVGCNDMFIARELLRQGVGIGGLPSFVAASDLASGRLVRILPNVATPVATVYLVHPSRKHPPSRLVAFRDTLIEALRQKPL